MFGSVKALSLCHGSVGDREPVAESIIPSAGYRAMSRTIRIEGWIWSAMLCMLAGCAARAPKGAEVVRPDWNGMIDSSIRLGVYLATEPGAYSQAGFETMSRAEEAMKALRPGIKWAWIDSSHPGTAQLNGWDLDSLSAVIRTDKALLDRAGTGMEKVALALAPSTRSALAKVGKAYGQDLLVAIRPGGFRAEKDSSKLFQDRAWIGVFDLREGTILYALQAPSEGKQSVEASAESDWARSVWEEFRKALENLPARIKK